MNKKQLIAALILLTISCLEGNAYAAQLEKKVFTEENQVKVIREKCAMMDVDGADTYKSKKKNLENWSIEGAVAIGYFDSKELKKVDVKAYGETFRALEVFYFSDGELIYATSTILRYIRPIGFEKEDPGFGFENPVNDEIGSIEENKYYFHKDKLIKWEGYERGEQEEAGRLIKNARDLIRLFKVK